MRAGQSLGGVALQPGQAASIDPSRVPSRCTSTPSGWASLWRLGTPGAEASRASTPPSARRRSHGRFGTRRAPT